MFFVFVFLYLFLLAIIDNNRYGSLEFDVNIDTVLHGFGGYFHCVLFGDVTISKYGVYIIISPLFGTRACFYKTLRQLFIP